MKLSLLAIALSCVMFAACDRDPAADPPIGADVTPPVADQPANDVPPATIPVPAPTPSPGQEPAGLARFDGYGDMRFGMSDDAATQAWGGELNRLGGEGDVCYYLTPKSVKVPSDFAFMIENDKFVRYGVGNDKETAPGGGKVGMSAMLIRGMYSGRIEEQPHKYVDGGHYLRIKDSGSNGVLLFETDAAGKVTEWRVGVPPQVDYVEGCS